MGAPVFACIPSGCRHLESLTFFGGCLRVCHRQAQSVCALFQLSMVDLSSHCSAFWPVCLLRMFEDYVGVDEFRNNPILPLFVVVHVVACLSARCSISNYCKFRDGS